MKELGIGVIGLGDMGRRHAENLRWRVPGARLAAVADIDPDRARSVAAQLGIDVCCDRVELVLAHPDVDAVVLSSPPGSHLAAISAAAAAGKHIFCEKPLTLTLADADAALDAVAAAGIHFQVGHMRRYDPPYVEARRRIQAGEIGQVMIFKSIGRDPESSLAAASLVELNGTLFHDSSSHDFDLARWLTGDEVVEVHAYTSSLALPGLAAFHAFDSGVVNLRFAGGAIGNVESCLQAFYGYDIRTEIVGTLGTLHIGHLQQTPLVSLTRSACTHDVVMHWLDRFSMAYLHELTDFVESLRLDRPPGVTGLDGRAALAVAVAAVQSCRESRPVKVVHRCT